MKSNIYENREKSSVADLTSVIQRKFYLNWEIDFSEQIISGYIDIDFEILKDTDEIALDGRALKIFKIEHVFEQGTSKSLDFTISDADLIKENHKSSKILIKLGKIQNKNTNLKIRIFYQTGSGSETSGLQWLKKEATKDKIAPFLFSQFQPIHARSVIPCQDAPGAKVTYLGWFLKKMS